MPVIYLVDLLKKDFSSDPYFLNPENFFDHHKEPIINYLGFREGFFSQPLQSLEKGIFIKAEEAFLNLNLKKVDSEWDFYQSSVLDFSVEDILESMPSQVSPEIGIYRKKLDLVERVEKRMDKFYGNLDNAEIRPFYVWGVNELVDNRKSLLSYKETQIKDFLISEFFDTSEAQFKEVNREILDYYKKYIVANIDSKFNK